VALVAWNNSYSVKVARCDNDHKKLFSLINTVHDAMSTRQRAQVVQQVVDELADYATYHFAAEESMMEMTKYPELASHRRQHQEFVTQLKQLQQDVIAGKGGQTITVVVFLNDWLNTHIQHSDQQYSAHLNANGIF
jgi:hemerythrin